MRDNSAWSTDVNNTQRGVGWQMEIDDARCKLTSVYPKIKLEPALVDFQFNEETDLIICAFNLDRSTDLFY